MFHDVAVVLSGNETSRTYLELHRICFDTCTRGFDLVLLEDADLVLHGPVTWYLGY